MSAEPTVPVAKLEKLWREFRRKAQKQRRWARQSTDWEFARTHRLIALEWEDACADLRNLIDDAKEASDAT